MTSDSDISKTDPAESSTAANDTTVSDSSSDENAKPVAYEGTLQPDKSATAIRAFSAKLFSEALKNGKENTVISPLSAYLALSLAGNGASGGTLAQFNSTLGCYSDKDCIMIGDINLYCRQLIASLTSTSGSTVLNIANSIWHTNAGGLAVNKTFAALTEGYYNADLFSVDFSSKDTLSRINGWIDSETKGLIKNMLDDLDPRTSMMLINTVYMNATWENRFRPDDTVKREFIKKNGDAIDVPFMNNGIRSEQYIKTDKYEGVLLPYDDGKLAMIALKTSSPELIADTVTELISAAKSQKVKLLIPKFDISYSVELNDALKAMGLTEAFDPEKSNFGGFFDGKNGFYIDKVLQKVAVKVGETGTEAAAATVIGVKATGILQPEEHITLIFDKPFTFLIVDLQTGTPLFMGRLDNPAA